MKRIVLAALMAAALLFALAGCADTAAEDGSTAQGESTPTESSTPEKAESSPVSIEKCAVGKDYNGDKTAVITFKWKNTTEKATDFLTTYTITTYVDGEEAERTFGEGDEDWYGDQKRIKPGKTQTFQAMYEWDGKSDIEVEVKEAFSFSDDVLASETFSL